MFIQVCFPSKDNVGLVVFFFFIHCEKKKISSQMLWESLSEVMMGCLDILGCLYTSG